MPLSSLVCLASCRLCCVCARALLFFLLVLCHSCVPFPPHALALTHGRICDSLGCGTSGLVRVDLEYVPQVQPLSCLAPAERGASGMLTAPVRCACRSPRRRRTLSPACKAATLMRQASRRLSAWCSPQKIPCHMQSVCRRRHQRGSRSRVLHAVAARLRRLLGGAYACIREQRREP